jgi:hypothetical protein
LSPAPAGSPRANPPSAAPALAGALQGFHAAEQAEHSATGTPPPKAPRRFNIPQNRSGAAETPLPRVPRRFNTPEKSANDDQPPPGVLPQVPKSLRRPGLRANDHLAPTPPDWKGPTPGGKETLGRLPTDPHDAPKYRGAEPIGRCYLYALTIALRRRGFTSATIAEGRANPQGFGWYEHMRDGLKAIMTVRTKASSWKEVDAVLDGDPNQILIVSLHKKEDGAHHAAAVYREGGKNVMKDATVYEDEGIGGVVVKDLDPEKWDVVGYSTFNEDVLKGIESRVPNKPRPRVPPQGGTPPAIP